MSDFRLLGIHRTWEDWCGMLLGMLIVISPWFPTSQAVADADRSLMVLNAFVVGIIVLGLAQLEYVALQRWEEVAEIVLGLWLIASPAIFGYANDTAMLCWHALLGVLVVLLGALQLWQDWNLSDQDLLKHGQ
ncbi:SPW repeat protein [Bradyrhizobium sp.]|uniref:SPW repeat domain-containing protein n=1 Tax=Bradyrhizobium sp. TaxID=376 RepID=UPI001D4DD078|nr:SPW repeat protein [Bradyrhizobium sp.]MBI5319709.1 SPW repeat protein [Bradyrhizobium sp.]